MLWFKKKVVLDVVYAQCQNKYNTRLVLVTSPLEQFGLYKFDFLFSLFDFYIISGLILSLCFILFSIQTNKIFNVFFYMEALFTKFIITFIKDALKILHFEFIEILGAIFILILVMNLMGMVPFQVAQTAQVVIAVVFGIISFFAINVYGFLKHGIKFWNLLWPQGSPYLLGPLLIIVEFVSYISRAFSLGIRLFANIMAGHILMKIFATVLFLTLFDLVGIVLISILFLVIILLETAVAFLQAYVFIMLLAIYVHDVLEGGH